MNLRQKTAAALQGALPAASVFAQSEANDLTFRQWAPTPPLGWNSFDCYGATVTESEVRANADYMEQHLKAYGYEYIVADIRWYDKWYDNSHAYNLRDAIYNVDTYGRLLPDEGRSLMLICCLWGTSAFVRK